MADEFDMASRLEAMHTAAAIAAAGTRPGRGPLWSDGVPCCRQCGETIPLARVRALPGCERCVRCQAELEGRAA
jgi:phage/conjugal plasmid C-4 type zinc finger TraR family protein